MTHKIGPQLALARRTQTSWQQSVNQRRKKFIPGSKAEASIKLNQRSISSNPALVNNL